MCKIIHKETILKFLPYSISATMFFLQCFRSVLVIWQPSYQCVYLFKATHILFPSVAWHVFSPFIPIFILVLLFGDFLLVWCFKTFCWIISLCPSCLILLFINFMFRVFIFTFCPVISCFFFSDFLSCYESKISALATFSKVSKAIMYILTVVR
jgi:hypothetical protein